MKNKMSNYFTKLQGLKNGTVEPEPKKKRKRIQPVSEKRKLEDEEYFRLREIFLAEHPRCECGRDGCRRKSTDVHHKKARGKYYLDVATWKAMARVCHIWLGENTEEARKLGLVEIRM